MAILIKSFYGAPAGSLYPQWFHVGSECPPELEAAASAVQALEPAKETEPSKNDPPSGTKKR